MSIRITTAMTLRQALSDIETASGRLSGTQQRLSSGKQLTKPSDDPYQVTRALQLRGELAANQQSQKNVQEASSWAATTDTALGNIGDYVGRARDLLVRGASDTAGTEARNASADEIDQIVEAIKGEANVKYAGRFVFAGTATDTPPYKVGAPATDPTRDSFLGNTGTVSRDIGSGVSVAVNSIGQNAIGDGTAGLIKTLRDVSADLRAGNSTALQSTDLKALDVAHDALLAERARVGATAERLDMATNRLQQLEETSTKLLSDTEDADMAKTMVDFSTQSSVYQAALKSSALIIQPSLMDFLR